MRYGWLAASGVGLLMLAGTAIGAGYGSHMGAGMMQAQSATQASSYRQFRGRITSVNRGNRTFWMRTGRSGQVHIGVGSGTRWSGHGCNWGAMRVGRHVYVDAYRQMGYWMASRVQPWQGNWDDHWGMMGDMGSHMGY